MYENVLTQDVAQQYIIARETNDSKLLSIFANDTKNTLLQIGAAANTATSEKDLTVLSENKEDCVREACAGNTAMPQKRLGILLKKDANQHVRARAGGNTSVSELDMEECLKTEKSWVVLAAILNNQHASDKILETIFNNIKNKVYGWENTIISSENGTLYDMFMVLFANHPNRSVKILQEISEM